MKITQIKAVVFDLAPSVFFVPARTALELENEDDVISQNDSIDSLSPSKNRVLQKQIPIAGGIGGKRRPQEFQLCTPGTQLFGGQYGECPLRYSGLAADNQVVLLPQELGNRRSIERGH